jgi:diguanylate cyclase (GGDEF)-like protein/PAS domain S-box-containing protein
VAPDGSSASPRWPKVLALLVGAVLVAHQAVWPYTRSGEVSFLVVGSGAAAAAWLGIAGARDRRTASLIAGGVGLSAAGDLLWQWYAWTNDQPPDVSIADVFWLGSYLAIGAALLTAPRGHRAGRRRVDRDGLLDVAVVALVAMVVQWELAMHEMVADEAIPVTSRLVWALYPACDAIVLALVVRAMVSGRLVGKAGWAIGAGTISWLAADFAYTTFQDDAFVPWMDTSWLLGAVLFAAATWVRPAASAGRPPEGKVSGASYGGILVALVPLMVPGGVAVLQHVRGKESDPFLLYAATLVLLALSVVRAFRLLRAERHAREALTAQERYAKAIAMNSSDAVMVIAADGRALADSPQLAALMGDPAAVTTGRDSLELVHRADRDRARAILRTCVATPGKTFEAEVRLVTGGRDEQWVGVRLVNLLDDPDVNGVVLNLHDITDRRRAQEQLLHQAFHDGLTGLANRALFVDRVEQALRRSARSTLGTAVMFLDLDGFKTINDSLGHSAGDALLVEVARRLNDVAGDGAVARLGGDEFAILIEQSSQPLTESESIAQRILAALDMPIWLESQAVTVSASIGIAVVNNEERLDASSVLRDADIAMYRAKAGGRARWMVHDPEMRMAAVERLRLGTDLSRALDAGQFSLLYQPVVELATERVVGFEALIRWQHPNFGVLTPDRFIPIAEDTGQIVRIGKWVIEEACRTAAVWQRAYPALPLTMAVNLSARQVASAELIRDVAAALASSGLDARSLVLEMTETTLVEDAEAAARRLTELRELGVRVAIDDFGTGYSSLSYLRKFTVDILKIDRSFVETIQRAGEVPAIVRGLLNLGHTLNLELIAEGVELPVQRDELRGHGCQLGQGYLFSTPISAVEAELLLIQQSVVARTQDAGRPPT